MTNLQGKHERDPLIVRMIYLFISFNIRPYTVVNKVIPMCSLKMLWEGESGTDPAVTVQDFPRHLTLVRHALDGGPAAVDVAIAGHKGAGNSEDPKGKLIMETEDKIIWSWILDLCFSSQESLSPF